MSEKRVEFIIVDSDGARETLACPKCGCVFDINAYTEENLVFDKKYKGLVSKCPDCGVLQEADDD